MIDEDLLNTMEAVTETARSVWKMMDEVIPYAQEANIDLPETLDIAVEITTRLKSKISAMRKGSGDSDQKTFWEDAHFFVKAIVSVLTTIKSWSASFSPVLKSNIAKLTQSTQDFAILLQVSSFSPVPTPSPYSPSPSALPVTPAKTPGILRSRSAQASQPGSTRARYSNRDPPKSALPHQSFKISDSEP
ncbi:hypothetical protein M422DRAFT_45628 [Sphaerobolus stellatus SS14]|uniref:Uncharacterized protein n=1 Tax=Sphaerobolus stellatus (strain SS14) TaxID=990650 RepID=A0A0C9UW75_SPHS4|nr:hypothetical protein M422DRAFT_45628 [Sphaerobolus stellatus SS14]